MIVRETIKKGSLTTTLFNIVGKLVGFLSIFLIAYYFGSNGKTDIYYLLLSFTGLIATLIATLQSTVFLPLFIKTKEKYGEKVAWDFLNSLFSFVTLFALIIALFFLYYSIELVIRFSKFDLQIITSSKNIILLFSPILALLIITDFLRTIIQSHNQFTFPALMVFCTNIIMVLLLLIFAKSIGVLIMAISVLGSLLFQLIIMVYYIKKYEPLFKVKFKLISQHKEYILLSLPIFFAQLFGSFSMFYYDYTATMFTAGTLTAIIFAQRIFLLPNDMLIMPISNVLTPVFSEHNAQKNDDLLLTDFVKYNNLIWFIVVPISVFLIFFSFPIVQLLFNHGNFNEVSVEISSLSLRYYSICLFGLSFVAIYTRVLYALQKTYLISSFGIMAGVLSMILTYYYSNYFGYLGIPLTRSFIVIFVSVPFGIILLYKYIKGFKIGLIFVELIKIFICAILAALISYFVYYIIIEYTFLQFKQILNLILNLSFSFLLYITVYLFLSHLSNIKGNQYLFEMIKFKKTFSG